MSFARYSKSILSRHVRQVKSQQYRSFSKHRSESLQNVASRWKAFSAVGLATSFAILVSPSVSAEDETQSEAIAEKSPLTHVQPAYISDSPYIASIHGDHLPGSNSEAPIETSPKQSEQSSSSPPTTTTTTTIAAAVPVSSTTTSSPEKGAEKVEPTPEEDRKAAPQGAFNEETGEINWDCPCLGGMADGPCGEDFKSAFSCFVFSDEEPKGQECVDYFRAMQECFRKHPEVYADQLDDDEDVDEDVDEVSAGEGVLPIFQEADLKEEKEEGQYGLAHAT